MRETDNIASAGRHSGRFMVQGPREEVALRRGRANLGHGSETNAPPAPIGRWGLCFVGLGKSVGTRKTENVIDASRGYLSAFRIQHSVVSQIWSEITRTVHRQPAECGAPAEGSRLPLLRMRFCFRRAGGWTFRQRLSNLRSARGTCWLDPATEVLKQRTPSNRRVWAFAARRRDP
jgi:hypothetical protein